MQPPIKEAVIALLDPDMLLLQPVSARVDSSTVLYSKGSDPTAGSWGYSSAAAAVRGTEPWVCEGHPVGQVSTELACSTTCSIQSTVMQLVLLFKLFVKRTAATVVCVTARVHHRSRTHISPNAAHCALLLSHSLLHQRCLAHST
jgi:hypothetical protein